MNKLNHLAIIADGNGRWAKQRGLPRSKGHFAGYKKIKQICDWSMEANIKFLTIYAFSYENWQRKPKEVLYLMQLILKILKDDIAGIHKKGFKLKVIGRLEKFSLPIRQAIKKAEQLTKNNIQGMLTLCLSYGGQQEIVDAVKKIITKGTNPKNISKETVQQNLYYPDLPPPDLIIRTGGEQRLSNFLTFQSAYSELCFLATFLPDFSQAEFKRIIKDFQERHRKYGK